jgi:hypothetical protein
MLLTTNYFAGADRKEMLRFITNDPVKSLEVGCREGNHSKLLKIKFPTLTETWGLNLIQISNWSKMLKRT